ncbi:hypothetical protein GCM10011611_36790 [Aliidongia dinghuensis]|uniref:NAD-dependent epimerase/dehydratase domain-containing protein n=1 Tax=Aliidongia dinghuensis TaxID=1867774 RepID=A0A8J2YWC6_9PROT|nr:NAD-dependent epimerase/dehydratase family protein [Aliidongia dinghuensis]GGF27399.1 hypothetical protein GCM10011611_36790 [Aliidongia dinghuensis]
MVQLAILGSTSRIAKDLICSLAQKHPSLALFSRRPDELAAWGREQHLPGTVQSLGYERFQDGAFDAVLNFVGSGDPARTAAIGSSILDITHEYDDLALTYLRRHPQTRYLFMSSGAAYGRTFLRPAQAYTQAEFPINGLSATDFYSVAKMYAECRHRALADAAIVDIRIFNYFSRTSDIAARFFMTDIVRAIANGEVLKVSEAPMRRDFLAPVDFAHLIDCVLRADPVNMAIDAYSKAPLEKFELLARMREEFSLRFEVVPAPPVVISTGAKPEYFSENRRAEMLGYHPTFSSIEGVVMEVRALFKQLGTVRG